MLMIKTENTSDLNKYFESYSKTQQEFIEISERYRASSLLTGILAPVSMFLLLLDDKISYIIDLYSIRIICGIFLQLHYIQL